MRILSVAAFLACPICAFAQAAPLAFEVASVKPAPPPSDPHRLSIRMSTDAGRLTYSNVSMRDLIRTAYKVKENQVSGPDWLQSERYEISAKLPEGSTKEQIPEMLQGLLADRFKLALHRETKVVPVYALVPGKGGPKLKAAEEGQGGLRMMMGPKGHRMSGSVTLSQLSDSLSNLLDRPVLDMTELKGAFAVEMEWTPDDGQAHGRFGAQSTGAHQHEGGDGKSAETADAPTIFTALQDKLGLKLESRKLPVELLTVDRVEKVPTEN